MKSFLKEFFIDYPSFLISFVFYSDDLDLESEFEKNIIKLVKFVISIIGVFVTTILAGTGIVLLLILLSPILPDNFWSLKGFPFTYFLWIIFFYIVFYLIYLESLNNINKKKKEITLTKNSSTEAVYVDVYKESEKLLKQGISKDEVLLQISEKVSFRKGESIIKNVSEKVREADIPEFLKVFKKFEINNDDRDDSVKANRLPEVRVSKKLAFKMTQEEKKKFPTLAQYDSEMLWKAMMELAVKGLTREQAMIKLEQDLAEIEARSIEK